MNSSAELRDMGTSTDTAGRGASRARWRGVRLLLLRAAVVATAALVASAFAAAQPGRFEELRRAPGLPPGGAAYLLGLEIAVALGFLGVALLIFARRSGDWPAALAAMTLAAFGGALPGTTFAIVRARPIWEVPFPPLQALGWALLLLFAYTFPDGHLRPRWTRPLAVAWVVWVFGFFLAGPRLAAPRPWLIGLSFAIWVAWFATGALAQAYRYVRLAGPAERQQTKWVVLGFVGAIGGTLVASLPGIAALSLPVSPEFAFTSGAAYQLAAATLASAAALLIPLTIAVAILRHRLFDVDALIHRALVYGALTGALAAVYAGCILGAQAALSGFAAARGDAPSSPVLVASTLATVALVRPLRRRIQAGIDRRFYRRRYDAARVLATFGASVRGQVDLPQVGRHLVAAVEETMRPAHVSLWLREPGRASAEQLQSATEATARPDGASRDGA